MFLELRNREHGFLNHSIDWAVLFSDKPSELNMTATKLILNYTWWFIPVSQWEFQDPKMEVLYHTRPYFVGIFPYIGLT